MPKIIAHRRDAEGRKGFFIMKFSLCALCVSAVNNIKMKDILNFSHWRTHELLQQLRP